MTVTGRPSRSLVAENRLRDPLPDQGEVTAPGDLRGDPSHDSEANLLRNARRFPAAAGSPGLQPFSLIDVRGSKGSHARDPAGLALLEPPDLVLGQHVPHVRCCLRPVVEQHRSARRDPVSSACRSTSQRTSSSPPMSGRTASTRSGLSREMSRSWSRSNTNAWPPVMPAPRFQPTGPRTTMVPPVMYSQQWSPALSTTAVAPELRTRSARPRRRPRTARRRWRRRGRCCRRGWAARRRRCPAGG